MYKTNYMTIEYAEVANWLGAFGMDSVIKDCAGIWNL